MPYVGRQFETFEFRKAWMSGADIDDELKKFSSEIRYPA